MKKEIYESRGGLLLIILIIKDMSLDLSNNPWTRGGCIWISKRSDKVLDPSSLIILIHPNIFIHWMRDGSSSDLSSDFCLPVEL